jgi:hypothetical protein
MGQFPIHQFSGSNTDAKTPTGYRHHFVLGDTYKGRLKNVTV